MGVRNAARAPSPAAYFVALGGILVLLLLLCCYFFYFCIRRVKELNQELSPTQPVAATPACTTYPVQQGVRDSATAMAKLCKQLPAAKGDTVFPTSTSPEAQRTDTGQANVRDTELEFPATVTGTRATEATQDFKVPTAAAGVVSDAPAVR